MQLDKKTSIFELLQKYPQVRRVFEKYNMNCDKCMGAEIETLEDGAKSCGVKLDILLRELEETTGLNK